MKTALFGNDPAWIRKVFNEGRLERLAGETVLYPKIVGEADFDQHAARLAEVEVVFATWGLWRPTPAQLDRLPALRAVFYAAGATDAFAPAFIARGIEVFSAWRANAVPVAEFAAAQILLALKGYFRNVREHAHPSARHGDGGAYVGPGVFGEMVALLGDGEIARGVRRRLADCDLSVRMTATDPAARDLSLDEAFRLAFVVSNHLPDRPDNRGCLTRGHFASMRPGAVFVNTGRGAQTDAEGLAAVAAERPDLTFLLDVTDPQEPLPPDHPYRHLPNVVVSTHIAGSANREVVRMADYMLEEFARWRAGEPTRHAIDPALLIAR